MISVKQYGAVGAGQDDFCALQRALDEERELFFPKGLYVVSDTLRVPSDRKIVFEEGATLRLVAKTARKRGDFLLTNKNHETGDTNIEIDGGAFDGNNAHPLHKRPNDIFAEDGYSGVLIDFCNVTNLTIKNVALVNPVAYYTRFCKINGFLIENVSLKSQRVLPNQDGIHFAGEVRNGVVRNVRAETFGQTNDDLLALNADDYLGRIEEFDTVCGAIENVLFEDIYAESCHDAVRLLSYRSPIKNVTFRNMTVGFRARAVDANAARGCRAELFKEKEEPQGVGDIADITFENCTFLHSIEYPLFWKGSRGGFPHPFITWGSLADNVRFVSCRFASAPPYARNGIERLVNAFKRAHYKRSAFPAMRLHFLPNEHVTYDGKSAQTTKKEDVITVPDFHDLTIDIIKPL